MPFFDRLKSGLADLVGVDEKHKEVGNCVKVGKFTVKIERVLAEGGFAVVFLAHDDRSKYALKKVSWCSPRVL
jgi:hypothetical protein